MKSYKKLTIDMLKDIKIENTILTQSENGALNKVVANIILNELKNDIENIDTLLSSK